MDIHTFMTNYREAFGERAELPIAFWYSDKQENETEKISGCFFKGLQQVREGKTISLNSDVIGCAAENSTPVSRKCLYTYLTSYP